MIGTKWTFLNRYYDIDGRIEPDAETEQMVEDLSGDFKKQMSKTMGYLNAEIDARFSVVRSRESLRVTSLLTSSAERITATGSF